MNSQPRFTEAIVNGIRKMIPARPLVPQPPLPTKAAYIEELMDSVRDSHAMSYFGPYGELGMISPKTRRIDPASATDEALNQALVEAYSWRAHYPETDDYQLVEWLEAVCNSELLSRSIAKMSGGVKPVMISAG